ncbi:ABC transporter permease [Streptomyces sp. SL13]|jgi:ribose/xylose/arabinose/galactoside ABC-type transport system permease subunit|uniref:ABC transporter permease n=1 Tax=Streptantibioticus silvisoli TaxID=2705255 RepID=A0AA90HAG6_9ACTN|nr:ABC transporter permease [Streptantibioticus silvisoli]MDI5963319.1 ABC transporter permease [Streptantibioticus silvisoli]MDI5971990.1 ABC transporter permease [Streptantibioticus silvisoli]
MSSTAVRDQAGPKTPGPDGTGRGERLAALVQKRGAPIVLLVVVVVASIASPGFADWANVSGVLGGNAFVWLLALGMTFVITTGGIDLSVGSMYALGGVLAADGSRAGSWAAVLLPLAVGAAWGTVQGMLVARARMAPFIVSLAGLLGVRGVLQAITNEGSTTYLVPAGSWARKLGEGTWTPVLIVAALFVLGGLLLTRTRFGATLTAIGGNENAAVLMGLPVARAKVYVYVLSGSLAGLAGALGGLRLGSGVTTIGVGYELTAIASVVIGGTLLTGGYGTVGGTVCGVLLLAVLHNLIDHYFSSYGSAFTDAVNGAFLALVVLSQTLLGRARHVE